MKITRIDPFTGKRNHWDIPVTQEQLDTWQQGALIQDAMPNLTAYQREFIMTGITPASWNAAFSDESDDGINDGYND